MNIETLKRGIVLKDRLELGQSQLREVSSEIEKSRAYIEIQEKGTDSANYTFGIEGRGGKLFFRYRSFGRTFLTCLAVLKAEIQQEVHRLEKEFAELRSE